MPVSSPYRSAVLALVRALAAGALAGAGSASAMGLVQAYEAALQHDASYRSAVFEKQAGQEFRELGRSNLLPSVSANYSRYRNHADITRQTLLGSSTEPRTYSSLVAAIQLRQPLYHPEGMARYRQGMAQANASDARFSAKEQDLLVRLVTLYFEAKYAEDQLALSVVQRDTFAEQRKANARMFERGEGTRTEMIETQAKLDLAEAQVLEAQDAVLNARNALSAMTGQPITRLDVMTENFHVRPMQPASYAEWETITLAQSPIIQAQRAAVDVAQEEVNKNRAGHLPRVDAIASVGKNKSDTTNTLDQDADIRSIGVQLTIPLYAGGSVSAATRQATSNLDKARADLDAATAELLVNLRKHYSASLSSVSRIDATANAVNSAQVLVEATRKSVQAGQRTNLDVLNAQQQLFGARRDLARARYNYLLSHIRLRSTAGTLQASDLQDVAGYFAEAR